MQEAVKAQQAAAGLSSKLLPMPSERTVFGLLWQQHVPAGAALHALCLGAAVGAVSSHLQATLLPLLSHRHLFPSPGTVLTQIVSVHDVDKAAPSSRCCADAPADWRASLAADADGTDLILLHSAASGSATALRVTPPPAPDAADAARAAIEARMHPSARPDQALAC